MLCGGAAIEGLQQPLMRTQMTERQGHLQRMRRTAARPIKFMLLQSCSAGKGHFVSENTGLVAAE